MEVLNNQPEEQNESNLVRRTKARSWEFKFKQINTNLSVGEILQNERRGREVSLNRAAADTKISAYYLQALESSNYAQLPGEVYARSFLKVYAKYLGLDPEEISNQYLSECTICKKTQKNSSRLDRRSPVERVGWLNLLVGPKIIRNLIIGGLVLICLFYLALKVNAIISPPFLEVTAPADNLAVKQKIVEVTGRVEKEAVLQINGQQVLTDGSGNFSEQILLQTGTNIIEITAQKKHSKPAVIYRKVAVIKEE